MRNKHIAIQGKLFNPPIPRLGRGESGSGPAAPMGALFSRAPRPLAPQGDALSPPLFLIYLEEIIRTAGLEEKLQQRDLIYAYADDVNFATFEDDGGESARCEDAERRACVKRRASRLERYLPKHFAKRHMQEKPHM